MEEVLEENIQTFINYNDNEETPNDYDLDYVEIISEDVTDEEYETEEYGFTFEV